MWERLRTKGRTTQMFKTEQFYSQSCQTILGMEKKDLTVKQLSSVDCPTCGVSAGIRCILSSGSLRSSPHVNRKVAAAETIGAKRISRS